VLVHLMISPSTLVWLHCILILAVGAGVSKHFVVPILVFVFSVLYSNLGITILLVCGRG
jgi:hypothetical protein